MTDSATMLMMLFRDVSDCVGAVDSPTIEGPTMGESDPLFMEPRPKWYNCFQT